MSLADLLNQATRDGALEVERRDLAALAPDMARLLIDMAAWVEHMEKHWGGGIAGSGPLLARFAALNAKAGGK